MLNISIKITIKKRPKLMYTARIFCVEMCHLTVIQDNQTSCLTALFSEIKVVYMDVLRVIHQYSYLGSLKAPSP